MGSVGKTDNKSYSQMTDRELDAAYNEIQNIKDRDVQLLAFNAMMGELNKREASRKEANSKTWNHSEGENMQNVSSSEAEKEIFNAPIGTVITMDNHLTGDYIGEYTKTQNGWVGSQKYRSRYKKPSNVSTAKGFAMQVSGNDIRIVKKGRR